MGYGNKYNCEPKIDVDAEKIRDILKEKDLNTTEVARMMGRSDKYFSNKLTKKPAQLTLADTKLLEAFCNIKVEEYELKEEEPVKEEVSQPKATVDIDYQRLQTVIRMGARPDLECWEAMLDRVVEPLKLDYERLYKLVYSATYEAVRKAWNDES